MELFTKHGIYSELEMHARYEIELENYIKKVQIESRVINDLAINHIVSTALKYQTLLVDNVRGQKEIGIDGQFYAPTVEIIKKIPGVTEHDFDVIVEDQEGIRRLLVEPYLLSLICFQINVRVVYGISLGAVLS